MQMATINSELVCPILSTKSRCCDRHNCVYVAQEKILGQNIPISQKHKYRLLFDTRDDIVLIIDHLDQIEYLNINYRKHKKEKIIGQNIYAFISYKFHDAVSRALQRARENYLPQKFEAALINNDIYEITATPIICKNKVIALCLIVKEITDQRRMQHKIAQQRESLEKKNIALLELATTVEIERNKTKTRIFNNLNKSISPIIHLLKKDKPENEKRLLEIIENAINNTIFENLRTLDIVDLKLSHREMRICLLIKNGMSAKEIAALSHVSERTIEKHKENIRKKLGLQGTRRSLATFLQDVRSC